MTPEFVKYWENVAENQPDSPENSFAHRMVDTHKVVFSHSQTAISGKNVEVKKVENGDLAAAIKELKQQPGKDILIYGGANFVSSLISQNLIDEYYIISHPTAIGKGLSIFNDRKLLKLVNRISYTNGKSLNKFVPV